MSEPTGASVLIEYALRHPAGKVDDQDTATTFGPTAYLQDAQSRLDLAVSDCLCSDGAEPHTLVARTVTVSAWAPQKADVKVGDADPTIGDVPADCDARNGVYACTWPRGHAGQHVAGTGVVVASVWS